MYGEIRMFSLYEDDYVRLLHLMRALKIAIITI